MLKVGTFVDSYNDDASIKSYIFKYKLKTLSSLDTTCGFPTSSINHIKGVLESKNINYLVVDKKMGYEEIDKMNLKRKINKNKYLYENGMISFKRMINNYID